MMIDVSAERPSQCVGAMTASHALKSRGGHLKHVRRPRTANRTSELWGSTLLGGNEGDGAEDGGREGVAVQAHAGEAVEQLDAVVDTLLVQAKGAAERHQPGHRLAPLGAAVILHHRLAPQRVALLKLLRVQFS